MGKITMQQSKQPVQTDFRDSSSFASARLLIGFEDKSATSCRSLSILGASADISRLLKRLIDVCGALIGLALFGPLLLAIACTLKLDGGSALYYHERVGLHGRRFRCIKFRSMVVDADRALERHLASNADALREWQKNQKLSDDPRVTKFGHFLRKNSFDELPQLINVLAGDMSLVGPRPVVADELSRYGDKLHLYLSVKPGITGLWQVSGRNDCTYAERVDLDALYVLKWDLYKDILILFRTVPAVLSQRGSG